MTPITYKNFVDQQPASAHHTALRGNFNQGQGRHSPYHITQSDAGSHQDDLKNDTITISI